MWPVVLDACHSESLLTQIKMLHYNVYIMVLHDNVCTYPTLLCGGVGMLCLQDVHLANTEGECKGLNTYAHTHFDVVHGVKKYNMYLPDTDMLWRGTADRCLAGALVPLSPPAQYHVRVCEMVTVNHG